MSNETPHTDVHVIGGGLAGLIAAATVAQAGRSVTVHEGRNRLGGRATTDDRNGFRFNQGPHAFYRSGAAGRVLVELGITPEGVTPDLSAAQVVAGDATHLAPFSASALLRSKYLGARDKLALGKLLTAFPKMTASAAAQSTAGEWIDSVTDRPRVRDFLHALVRLSTYANAPDILSAEVVLEQIQLSLDGGVVYLDHGWEQIVEKLRRIDGVTVRPDSVVTSVDDLPTGAAVIVAAGGPEAAAQLTGHPYRSAGAATAATLDLGLAGTAQHTFVMGIDQPLYGSDHGSAEGMVPDGRANMCLAEYLPVGADDGRSPAESRARLRAFAGHAGITGDRILEERYLHRMVVITSIATAADGGYAGRPGIAVPDRPGIFVAGDWVGPTGHMADAVAASARAAGRAAVTHLERRPAAA